MPVETRFVSLLLILIVLFSSCTDQMDGKAAAKQYCGCMKSNNASEQYGYAYTLCKAELAKKYRFYRVFYIDMADKELNKKLLPATKDSTDKFIDAFLEYRNENNVLLKKNTQKIPF